MSETSQLTSNNTEFENDCEEEIEPLNKSLTSMDWLQKLNADYVTQTNSDNTIKGCLSLFNYFIDMSPTLMSPFFVEKTCF